MTSSARTLPSLMLGAWVLLMPPVPLGTSLPPISEWTPMAAYKTSGECEARMEAAHDEAEQTISADPNASALEIAAAMGQLQAICVEVVVPEPAESGKPATSAKPAEPADSE